jgi:hypothetical protein
MPIHIGMEYTSGEKKKFTIKGGYLRILSYTSPADFGKFLEAVKDEVISITYLGYGAHSVLTEEKSPEYEKLESFFRNRTNEFFKVQGTIEIRGNPTDFYIESEVAKDMPHNLRIYSESAVADALEDLLK